MATNIINSKKKHITCGQQHLTCKNPFCNSLLKTVTFLDNWEKEEDPCSEELKLLYENGFYFYDCPACHAKNFVIFEGEKIILEKIIDYEDAVPKLPKTIKGKSGTKLQPVLLLRDLACEI